MEDIKPKQTNNKDFTDQRLQNILRSLSKCKIDFINEKEDCKKIRDVNAKLEVGLKEARELEKSHRYHLLSSREMIGNLQETISQLVHLKRDVKKLKEEIISRDKTIADMEKDKENMMHTNDGNIQVLRKSHERHVEEITAINERKIQQVQHECDTQVAMLTCDIEELRTKIKDIEASARDKMNVVVLEYEEKIQRGAAQVSQLQEQLARQAAKTDANIDAYRRRIEELEDTLKKNRFKQYLAQTYPSQFETQVERPYSANREYLETCAVDMDPVLEGQRKITPMSSQNKTKQSTLQVMYYGNKTPAAAEKKGQFNISKKRKLYNDKDFQDF